MAVGLPYLRESETLADHRAQTVEHDRAVHRGSKGGRRRVTGGGESPPVLRQAQHERIFERAYLASGCDSAGICAGGS